MVHRGPTSIMTTVATATAVQPGSAHPVVNRPNMTSVGTIVWLSSELMFFAALFAIYFTIRSVAPQLWETGPEVLNIPFAVSTTTVLVLSSLTCQLGVFAAERLQVRRTGPLLAMGRWGMQEWFVLTFLMGAFFIGGQAYEYAKLFTEGHTLASDAYFSIFFLSTGFHGLHVVGGLLAFLIILGRSFVTRRFTHGQATGAIVVSYYWHFVDVVWVGLFATIYLLK